jgi:hypothetical protein
MSFISVVDYDAFIAKYSTFRVYDFGTAWLMKRLHNNGASLGDVAAR